MDTLAQCVTRAGVRLALQGLPKDLDETYEHILRNIDQSQNAGYALKLPLNVRLLQNNCNKPWALS